jgi:hypothetical protein
MHRTSTPVRPAALLLCLLGACGGGDKSITNPPPPTPPPATTPPVTLPANDPLPGSKSCSRLGAGQEGRCSRDRPTFLGEIDTALDQLVREQANLFQNGEDGLRVVSYGKFYVAFLEKLDAQGICAAFDGEEVALKTSDSFNDQYHMVTSKMILRRGESSYRASCYPASFPGPARGYPPKNGCALPSSVEITCGREKPSFLSAVDAAIDQVAKEHPEVFNLAGRQPGEGWYEIADVAKYDLYVMEALKAKGFCARHDGEELVVKKENKWSEHFDISTSEGNVRRGDGSYRATCYPASF